MSILKISEAREYARIAKELNKNAFGQTKTASKILNEQRENDSIFKSYNVFLSHAFKDSDLVLGAKAKLEECGLKVYVDWLEDYELDRSEVNKDTASLIRERMLRCDSLFYFTTNNSEYSKWMPWETGFFDGKRGKVAILPVINDDKSGFIGREYLDLYPFVDFYKNEVWLNVDNKTLQYKRWINGELI